MTLGKSLNEFKPVNTKRLFVQTTQFEQFESLELPLP